jgi:hypothetical protein
MKSKRVWISDIKDADSCIIVNVYDDYVDMTLRDCSRSISWSFNYNSKRDRSNTTKSLRKIRKVKAVVDELEAFLAEKAKKK